MDTALNALADTVPEAVGAAETFPQFIRAIADAYGDATAVTLRIEGVPDDAITYAELERQSAALARGLVARGIGKGSRVGFIHGNGPGFALYFAAIARIGAVAVPVSSLLKANELVRVLRQSDVAGLIVQRRLLGHDLVARVVEALPELAEAATPGLRIARVPYLRWVVSTGEGLPAAIQDVSALQDGAETVDEALLREIEAEVHSTDQLVEIYTSGSMALPKGVRHDHGPAMFRTHYLRRMTKPERGVERTMFLPMFWVGGLMLMLLPALSAGAVAVCTEGTATNSLTAMGSVLSGDDLARMYQQPPPYWGLGMSETMGPYSYGDVVRVPEYPVCAPLDHVADGYELRVVDEENRPVSDGGVGEIQVRGYAVTPGLHKMPRSYSYTPDGFYRTGDMGLIDGARIHFVGRNGDMIKSAGSNVSPAEVEMEMQQLEGIHSAYVVGLPDAERGQLVAAAVVPRDGAAFDADAVTKELRRRLSPYKVPRAYVQITRAEVPMLFSNKVARREIQKMVAERLGRPAA